MSSDRRSNRKLTRSSATWWVIGLVILGSLSVYALWFAAPIVRGEPQGTIADRGIETFLDALPDEVRQLLGEDFAVRSIAYALATDCGSDDLQPQDQLAAAIGAACEEVERVHDLPLPQIVSLQDICQDSSRAPCTVAPIGLGPDR